MGFSPEPAPLRPGICDGCNAESDQLTLVPGTQWANCPACRDKRPHVALIVHGYRTESMEAIGRADAETLRLAAKCCQTAEHDALAHMLPASGYRQRRQFCRRRLTIIAPSAKPERHTFRP